jgi:hypothetical protein
MCRSKARINWTCSLWIGYRTALYSVIRQQKLVKWARQKYKKLRNRVQRARRWVATVSRRAPHLFAHWARRRGGSLMGAHDARVSRTVLRAPRGETPWGDSPSQNPHLTKETL